VKVKPRWYMFYFEDEQTCPRCGTRKLGRLAAPDHIDPMRWNFFNLARGWVEVQLYHCRYCRIQFYGRRQGRPAAR
jgi:hypothetical protein